MKQILILLLAVALSGCDVPSSFYHTAKLARLRSETVTLDELHSVLHITEQQMEGYSARPLEPIVVIARIPAEAESAPRSNWQQWRLPLSQRQIIESVFSQRLLAKGYQAASRMDVLPVSNEAQFPPRRGNLSPAWEFMRGTNLLIVSVSSFSLEESTYFRRSNYQAGTTYPVGTQVRLHISASLIDSTTTSSRWVATASAEAVLVGKPSAEAVLERVAFHMAERLPVVHRPAGQGSTR